MRYVIVCVIAIALFAPANVLAIDKDLVASATVSMEEAIKTALATVPGGKAAEVKLAKKKGQVAYQVEIVDASNNEHKVYVDAQNGKLIVEQKTMP